MVATNSRSRTVVGWLAALAVLAFVFSDLASGLDGKAQGDKKKRPDAAAEKWAVIEVGKTLKVVQASEIKGIKETMVKEYKAALSSWSAARADAKKAKQKFTTARPKKPALRVLSAKFDKREAAEKFMAAEVEKNKKKKARAKKPKSDKKGSGKKGSSKKDDGDDSDS